MTSFQELTTSGEKTHSMNPLATAAIEPGTVLLGKFRVKGLLGVGGMGSVYSVDHLLMERQFALKCMNKFQEANASWRRFQNEAKAANMLDHPNLLKVYEFGLLESGQPFFLMEQIDGITLADEIKTLGHLPVDRAVSLFIQVAFAIGYAHERKIIHRDLKPNNIMLVPPKSTCEVETVKVVDFGIAKLTGVDEFNQQTLTKTGEIVGSPFYMSPEQCMGLPVDHRSDLYSLGCVMYETLTSAPPFLGENALATMMKHQNELQLSLKEASLGLSYPAALESIVSRLLEKDPDKRYQSAGQLAADLIALERAFNDRKQQTSGQGPVSLSLAPDTVKKRRIDHWIKSMTLTRFIASCACMYILGAASLYLLYLFTQLQAPPARTAAADTNMEPEISKEGHQFWSQIAGGKKTFYFPPYKIVGLLVGANGSSGLARGRVTAPPNMNTGLIASNFLTPEFMEKFRPEEITVFDFNANTVTADHFNALKRFSDLRCLNVSGTAFGDKDLEILPSLKKLQYLSLSHTDVECENLLKYPTIYKLNYLDVSHLVGADELFKNIDRFPHLYELAATVCGLGDHSLANLTKSKSLKVLALSTNSISDKGIATLLPLKTLEWLDLSRTLVTPKLASIVKKFPRLKKLEMGLRDWTPQVKEKFVKEIKQVNPNVEIYFDEIATHDPANLPGFHWLGGGLIGHANTARMLPPPPTDSVTERRQAPKLESDFHPEQIK